MKNRMAIYMVVVAVLIFTTAFIGGFVMGSAYTVPAEFSVNEPTFNFSVMIYCWIGGLILGSVFLAFSEVINRLSKLAAKFGVEERVHYPQYESELSNRINIKKEDLKEPAVPKE